jgi:exosortase
VSTGALEFESRDRRRFLLIAGACSLALAIAYRALLTGFAPPSALGAVESLVFGERQEIAGLVALAVVGLAWRRWPQSGNASLGARAWAGVAAIGCVAAFGWAHYAASNFALVASIPLLVATCALAGRGGSGLRRMLAPLAISVLALPLPPRLFQSVVWELQLASARLGSSLLSFAGVVHVRSGIAIERGDAHFLVAEPCSGLQSLVTLTLIAVLVRELLGLDRWRSALLLLFAPAAAFALNALRVAWIACLDPAEGEAASHESQGLAVLAAGSLLLYCAGLALAGRTRAETRAAVPPASSAAALPWRRSSFLTAALLALSFVPAGESPRRAQPPLAAIDLVSPAGWVASARPVDRSFLGTLSIGTLASYRYARPGESVDLVVGADVGWPSRSPFSPKTLLPGRAFRLEETRSRCLSRLQRCVDVAIVRDPRETRLVYHWRFGDGGYAHDLARELTGIASSPYADSRARGFVQISTEIDAVRPDARARAQQTLDRYLIAYARALRALDAATPGPDGHASSAG